MNGQREKVCVVQCYNTTPIAMKLADGDLLIY